MEDYDEEYVAPKKSNKKVQIKELPPTDFSEQPTKGNPNNIEVGNKIELSRSMKVLDSSGGVWFSGVQATVKEIHPQESGLIVAKIARVDGTSTLVYICWIAKI